MRQEVQGPCFPQLARGYWKKENQEAWNTAPDCQARPSGPGGEQSSELGVEPALT